MTPAKWSEYPNFTKSEFDCKHTGLNEMKHEFMATLQHIRTQYGKPMTITSGYRHPTHPIEAKKGHDRGEHTKGMCADIACTTSADRYVLIDLALKHGIGRIGVAKTFLHFGLGAPGLPNKVIWEYQ
jgi:uncharacterized protein YcbK (DUF882 family)